MDPATLSALLNAPRAAHAVACFLGLAESIDQKAQKLCSAPYNSAIRFLRAAESSDTQQEHLLREAQRSFTDALTLETGSRLATAYLGLAVCQTYLGDTRNAASTLNELIERPFPDHRSKFAVAKLGFRMLFPQVHLALHMFGASDAFDRLVDHVGRLPDAEAALELRATARTYVARNERAAANGSGLSRSSIKRRLSRQRSS